MGADRQVMPNINTYDCRPTLSEFARTFPSSRQGECITIALASDNPGYAQRYLYEPNAPPPPLHKVIESTGSGCRRVVRSAALGRWSHPRCFGWKITSPHSFPSTTYRHKKVRWPGRVAAAAREPTDEHLARGQWVA